MAAGNYTASDMQVAQVKLEAMFADPNVARTEMLKGEAASARALLQRQTVTSVPRLTGGACVGVDLYYIRTHAADVTSQVAGLSGCALPTATEGESLKQTFTTTTLAAASAKLKDNRCDNLVDFQDEMAQAQRHVMSELRYILNTSIVLPAITAAQQANLDTMIDATWDDTLPRIIVPSADFSFANLNEFRIVAKNNNFGNFFFLSGRLFNDDHWMAMLNKMNEGERNQMLAWANREIYFDERDLDVTMTKKTAFAIDENSYGFWNAYVSSSVPQLTDTASGEHFTWSVADPFLVWNDNGRLKPVVYEMEMIKACTGRNALGFPQHTYTIWGRLLGGFEFVHEGPNGETGVLEFGEEAL